MSMNSSTKKRKNPKKETISAKKDVLQLQYLRQIKKQKTDSERRTSNHMELVLNPLLGQWEKNLKERRK